jgi:hypothetical protein
MRFAANSPDGCPSLSNCTGDVRHCRRRVKTLDPAKNKIGNWPLMLFALRSVLAVSDRAYPEIELYSEIRRFN